MNEWRLLPENAKEMNVDVETTETKDLLSDEDLL